MKWERKAAIARACARQPFGDALYRSGQKHMGALYVAPLRRLSTQAEMCRRLIVSGRRIEGMRTLEVGTGHVPVVPLERRWRNSQDFLAAAGLRLERSEATVDPAALEALRGGFPADAGFARYRPEDLSTTQLKLLMRARSSSRH